MGEDLKNMLRKAAKKINLTFSVGALGVISWLIGNWEQIAGKNLLFGIPYWYWWANGLFFLMLAMFLKVLHVLNKK